MRNKTPLKIITFLLFVISMTLGLIGYKYKIDHPEVLPYIILGNKNASEFMRVYKDSDGSLCIEENCKGELYLIIMSENSNTLLLSGNANTNYLLIESENLRLINLKERKEEILNLKANSYNLILEDGKSYNQDNLLLEPIGITFSKDGLNGYYNIKTKEIMYENYNNISILNQDYLLNKEENKITLLDINKENIILEIEEDNIIKNLRKIETENNKAYVTILNNDKTTYLIYDLSSKEKIGTITGTFTSINKSNSKIIAFTKDEIVVYNLDGTVFKRRNLSSNENINIIDNYYVIIEKGNLLLIDLETNEEKILMDVTSNDYLDKMYKSSVLKDDGTTSPVIIVVVKEINTIGKITKSYDISFNLETKEVDIIEE